MKKTFKWKGEIFIIDENIETEDEFEKYFIERTDDYVSKGDELTYEAYKIMIRDESGRIAGVQASFLNKKYKELIYLREMKNYIPILVKVPKFERAVKVTVDDYPVNWNLLRTSIREQIINEILYKNETSGTIECDIPVVELRRFIPYEVIQKELKEQKNLEKTSQYNVIAKMQIEQGENYVQRG